jgi:hypothetical protein
MTDRVSQPSDLTQVALKTIVITVQPAQAGVESGRRFSRVKLITSTLMGVLHGSSAECAFVNFLVRGCATVG